MGTRTLEHRICISNRNETVLIDPKKIAYVEADGNYVHVSCIYNQRFLLNYSLSDFLEILYSCGSCHFIKIGRSLIVNTDYIIRIYPQKNQLLLSDMKNWNHQLDLPKKTLNRLCSQIGKLFCSNHKTTSSKNKKSSSNDM